jgi:arabinose-5-phosphate isomerase
MPEQTDIMRAPPDQNASLLAICSGALQAEADAISEFARGMDSTFVQAVHLLAASSGPVIVAGIGKSGHIARKVAATIRSIGKQAAFLHASEASHGDLGLIAPDSAVIIFSNSGETSELSDLIFYCEAFSLPIVAVTASAESTLGKCAKIAIAYGQITEVCPNGLAPTTSTTLSLAIGDGLAIGLAEVLGTTPDDFRRYHPGGKLGAKLVRVRDIMHAGDALPLVAPTAPMNDVVVRMSEKGFGIAIVERNGTILGVITDGDMRRHAVDLWKRVAQDLVLGPPLTICADSYATEALELMTARGITCLIVESESGAFQGLIHIHDCLRTSV